MIVETSRYTLFTTWDMCRKLLQLREKSQVEPDKKHILDVLLQSKFSKMHTVTEVVIAVLGKGSRSNVDLDEDDLPAGVIFLHKKKLYF